jgi:energy-coupling factor transporter ATP-binding protein EcfA2
MVKSIHVTRLRGVREGTLEAIAPLTVLVGPNGCGKSTILDAIHIGAGSRPLDAVGHAVTRRRGVRDGGPWLLWRKGRDGDAFIVAIADGGHARASKLEVTEAQGSGPAYAYCEWRTASPGDGSVRDSWIANRFWREGDSEAHRSKRDRVALPSGEPYRCGALTDTMAGVGEVRLVEPSSHSDARPLHRLYQEATTAGRRRHATDLVRRVIPDLQHLEVLTEPGPDPGQDVPLLHMVFPTHSVPVALAGDGAVALIRAALELGSAKDGTVLLEEPEAHQHPGAIVETAVAIHAAVAQGTQVVLSTHSLDVLDALLSQAPAGFAFDRLAVYRLALHDGTLKTQRLDGSDVQFHRERIGDDLR